MANVATKASVNAGEGAKAGKQTTDLRQRQHLKSSGCVAHLL
jgi:hypothetical protein